MQLLIQRDRFITAMNKSGFNLWVKYELTKDERVLIGKYGIYNTLLVEGRPGELVKAAIGAIFLTVVILFLFIRITPDPIRVVAVVLGLLFRVPPRFV